MKRPRSERSKVNREVLRTVNRDVALNARRLSTSLLTSIFRSLFKIQQSYEFAGPEVFALDGDPDGILWSRLDAVKMRRFATYVANEEVLSKRYDLETEYEVTILADLTHSMALDWWHILEAQPGLVDDRDVRPVPTLLRSKLYLLKYIVCSFLHAAKSNGFDSRVILFGGSRSRMVLASRTIPGLEQAVLARIDSFMTETLRSPEQHIRDAPIAAVLREEIERTCRRVILIVSDFMDGVCFRDRDAPRMRAWDIAPLLAELAARYHLIGLKVNDPRELFYVEGIGTSHTVDTPYGDQEIRIAKKQFDEEKDVMPFVRESKAWNEAVGEMFRRCGAGFVVAPGRLDEHALLRVAGTGIR